MITANNFSDIARVSDFLQVISPEVRLEILLSIGSDEVCVCHLEKALGYRQAHISQHLMALREAGLVGTRREGKYIYYRLEKPGIMEMVELAARLANFDISNFTKKVSMTKSICVCPKCVPQKE